MRKQPYNSFSNGIIHKSFNYKYEKIRNASLKFFQEGARYSSSVSFTDIIYIAVHTSTVLYCLMRSLFCKKQYNIVLSFCRRCTFNKFIFQSLCTDLDGKSSFEAGVCLIKTASFLFLLFFSLFCNWNFLKRYIVF